jgi:ATP-dependent RNA helicase HelY
VTVVPPASNVGADGAGGVTYPFQLDPFQLRAIDALDEDRSVLVAAPTGSGKTVVAEHAVARALSEGRKAFYTTPIKALSNQKFADLARRHGTDNVGLLTGDNSINGDAPVVVMTTEVLRNMIYSGSPALTGLRFVVLDEVHYLQDAYRGPVWEEVIIHLPAEVRLVCLSATVSNAEEVAEWLETVRGPTTLVLEEQRPVELRNLYLVGDRQSERPHLLPTLIDGRPNTEAERLDNDTLHGRGPRRGPARRPRRRFFTPRRPEVIDMLAEREMLPALYFIFSRMGCEDAVAACLDAGLRLTTPDERARIRAIVEERTASLTDDDLDVLGYDRWEAALEMGLAAHHAGMVPPFKEAVEQCFVEGLVKVVFATETLAVGINMPARTVAIEKLSKFTGDHHQFLTAGEYTQLTGRAGRRGIDTLGHAVVLWSPFVPFDQVAALAASRSFQLSSAFRPTYNMTANLVRSYSRDQAHHLLNLSFAQYQADRHVVRLEARLERRLAQLDSYRSAAASPYGDIEEYRALLRRVERPTPPDDVIELALMKLRPGDVLQVPGQPSDGRVAVITTARRKGGIKLQVLTPNRRTVALSARDFHDPPRAVARIDLPSPFAPNRQQFQRAVVRALDRAELAPMPRAGRRGPTRRAELDEHPVAADPNLNERLKAAAAVERTAREVDELRARVQGRTHSVSRRFDRVLRILETWGYVDGWSLAAAGETLARTFHECDLLVVEALRQGHLDGLDAPTLAGLVSVFTYEHRSPDTPPAPWFPSHEARHRWAAIEAMARQLREAEEEAGLTPMRAPDASFVGIAYAWAAGESFATVVEDEELSGGDFVRNVKQLIDLLRQLGEVAPREPTRASAREAAERLFRGVVAASSGIGADEAAEESA